MPTYRKLPASRAWVMTREQDCVFCGKPAAIPFKKKGFVCASCNKLLK